MALYIPKFYFILKKFEAFKKFSYGKNIFSTEIMTGNFFEMWEVKDNFLLYSIDKIKKTASVVGNESQSPNIIIPTSITVNSENYLVTSVLNFHSNSLSSVNIETIRFAPDSQLKLIGPKSFNEVQIKTFYLPSHVTKIGESAFEYSNLENFIIPDDSELEEIEDKALYTSNFESFRFPKHVKAITRFLFTGCFGLQEIQIPPDSELQIIKSGSLSESYIRSISVLPKNIQLEKGWCKDTGSLTSIKIDENHPLYKSYENTFIIGKSSIKQKNYDVLVFCNRDVKQVTIPSFIKFIDAFSFEQCKSLEKVIIPEDSKLEIIDAFAFANSGLKEIDFPEDCKLIEIKEGAFKQTPIKEITFPSDIMHIHSEAFHLCKNLSTINFPFYCALKTIRERSFSETSISSILFPSQLKMIGIKSFFNCKKLTKVQFDEDSQIKVIEDTAFTGTLIRELSIPSSVTCLKKYALSKCSLLSKFEIPADSKLQTIEGLAFQLSGIQGITIPCLVNIIQPFTFYKCKKLNWINFRENSQLTTIQKDAFLESAIYSLTIPSKCINLEEGWCNGIRNLINIRVEEQNPRYKLYENMFIIGKSSIEQTNYDILVFCLRNAINVTIPSFITKIGPYSFDSCQYINTVTIPNDSKLQIIDNNAFNCVNIDGDVYSNKIKRFEIPSSVKQIGNHCFCFCKELEDFVVPFNSKLQVIGDGAFSNTSIRCISFPSKIEKIGSHVFTNCTKLEIIEFGSGIEKLNASMFNKCNKALILVSISNKTI